MSWQQFKHAWLIKFWAPSLRSSRRVFSLLTILALLAPFGLSRVNLPVGAASSCNCSVSMLKSGVTLKLSIWKDRH